MQKIKKKRKRKKKKKEITKIIIESRRETLIKH